MSKDHIKKNASIRKNNLAQMQGYKIMEKMQVAETTLK